MSWLPSNHGLAAFDIIVPVVPQTLYCYHCGIHHPAEEMRQIMTKGGKRWRCMKSLKLAKRDQDQRDAFGRRVSLQNKAEAQYQTRITRARPTVTTP